MKKSNYLFFAILFFSLLALRCGSAEGPADVAKDFFMKVADNDKSALDLLSPQLVETLGHEKLEKGIEKEAASVKEKGGIKSIDVEEEKVEEKSASLKLKITYSDGSTKSEKMDLMLVEDKWKIGVSK